jgi:hypothetical protein
MAVDARRFFPLRQARLRRYNLGRYLAFDSSRYLLAIILLLCLMSLLTLGQTGVVATRGYAVRDLEQHRTELLRLQSQLEVRYAEARSLEYVRSKAEAMGLRPVSSDQLRYVTVVTRSPQHSKELSTVSAARRLFLPPQAQEDREDGE